MQSSIVMFTIYEKSLPWGMYNPNTCRNCSYKFIRLMSVLLWKKPCILQHSMPARAVPCLQSANLVAGCILSQVTGLQQI